MAIEPFPGLGLTERMRGALSVEERLMPGPPDAPDIRVLLYRPNDLIATAPLIVSIHGGAFGMRADHFPAIDGRLALLGALVVSVDYRSLPEHTYPTGAEDCYAALCWSVKELDIDPAKVVVTGASAGGALAAAMPFMSRDRGGPAITFQALRIPVLDDRLDTPSMRTFGEGHPGFNAVSAARMWTDYLGAGYDRSRTSPYAAPSRAEDLSGLPPAVIQVNGLDPLRDEGIEYAGRLMAAGIAVELYCAPGAYHGADPLDPCTRLVGDNILHDAIAAAIA
jgi:acetyl esterase/lipase